MSGLFAILSTHTPRHLAAVLTGVARQSRPADGVVVTCDVESAEIEAVVRDHAAEFAGGLGLVQRSHQGQSRSSQVRNNGVRALLPRDLTANDRLVFLDGDCCPSPTCFAEHERLLESGDLVIGFRYDLTQQQTEAFDPDAGRRGREPVAITGEQHAALRDRERRYRRHAWLRRFGLGKPHKPKLLSANFSIRAGTMLAINGFDEEYLGYGGEDDDLGRRVYAAGGRPVIGIGRATVYHLWHPTRAGARWEDAPGIARFKLKTPTRAAFGIDRPYQQPEPSVTWFGPGVPVEGRAAVGGALR